MYFNFRTFIRAAYLSFFRWKDGPVRFSFKRILSLIIFFTIFSLFQLFNFFCFLLDDIFYSAWRKLELVEPVFIIGNPRSGTTFIQRVMSIDETQFFFFRTWEIIFPAIIQKKILSLCGHLDRRMGRLFSNFIKRVEARTFQNLNKMHGFSLFYPEEDDKLTLHIFSSMDLIWFFPFKEVTYSYSRFDELVDEKERQRIMTFYKNCIMRQAYFKGNKGRLLSKSPVLSPKLQSLSEYFPGCKFIWPVRNPLEVIPSMISMAEEVWRSAVELKDDYPYSDIVYDTLSYFHKYLLKRFSEAPKNSYMIVKYDDLITTPSQVIKQIYNHFDFKITGETINLLEEEEAKAKHYKSKHVYSLDQFNITREQIISDFSAIFKKFEFSVEDDETNLK